MAFRSYQTNVECLPIDHDGLDTEASSAILRQGGSPNSSTPSPIIRTPPG
jgi:hypothetical protein